MAVNIVETEGLSKRYGSLVALNDLNLSIEEGSIYGFIGPNGAGKTTTLKILATLLSPSTGSVNICGVNVLKSPEEARELIGYMPDFFGVYDDMKVWEYMDFFGAAFRIAKARRASIIDDLLSLVDLGDKKDSYVESLSRGMKQRLCLARALIHDPKLLILDEPASGLDPRARVEMRELLKELKRMGKTIIVSSHILPELSELCTHIGIIERGTLLVSGEVEKIIGGMKVSRTLRVKVIDEPNAVIPLLSERPGIENVHVLEDDLIEMEFKGAEDEIPSIHELLISKDVKVIYLNEVPLDLEDVFFHITKGALQ
ncbi:MAG: ABC transporter ATP-binding protein [Actinomycetota bacterium]